MSAYRNPERTAEVPPSCICWAGATLKACYAAVGGWFHSPECEDYQRRHPEMMVADKRQGWRWSAEAVRLANG